MRTILESLRTFILTALGFVLLFTLPAIWIAWSGTWLWIIVANGFAAGILFCLLYPGSALDDPGDQPL